ncbi:MAG: M3 family oligoendopeptidase, partial [Chloroflexi bacterium]|nr:M3 family oligoendopeptidase [Chloroflexota bacterium]
MTTFPQTRWSLTDLLDAPDGPRFNDYQSQLTELLNEFETARSILSPEIPLPDFVRVLDTYESIGVAMRHLVGYASLWFTEDTQKQEALIYKARMDQLSADVQNRTLFFSLWFKSLDAAQADRLIAASGDRRYYLEATRHFKPYTLSEVEEKLINLKDVNGIEALVQLYDMITSKFEFTLEIDGEQKTMTRDELGSYVRHPSPQVRAAVYQELYRVYGDQRLVLAQIYSNRVRDWHNESIQLRGYCEPISVRNLANDIPDSVTDTLLSVARQNNHLYQRYFKLKAKWLGMPKLRRYDVYAPLLQAEKRYEFGVAADLVLASYGDFSPTLADHARRVFAENHIDSELRTGKRGGAFCYSALPQMAPWVLINFAGRARDVATLAHELGHAVHALMAQEHSVLTFHSSLPLAETASTFGEMLLTDRLLKNETDAAVRRDLLADKIDDTYATIQRQAYFTLFERDAHRLVMDNKSADEIAAHYLTNLQEQFGDALDIGDEFKWEWISIPHFYHVPFYTYAYSFGQLFALALYQMYRQDGESFE